MTKCLLRRGVCLREVKKNLFYMGGNMAKCTLKGGVYLWEVCL